MQRNNFNLHVHRTPAQDHFTDTYGFTIFNFKLSSTDVSKHRLNEIHDHDPHYT